MAGRIFLANVGANAAHRVRSPLFRDGRFEFVTIPEGEQFPHPQVATYQDLRSFYDSTQDLSAFLPPSYWPRSTHLDPEFETFTYGDNCERHSRAAGLKALDAGDLLFFLARLVPWEGGQFRGPPGFFLIGFLEVAAVLRSVTVILGPTELAVFGRNAHVRRALANSNYWNGFWVFKGSDRSKRFEYAVPLTRELAIATLRNARGEPLSWDSHRSDLQIIGSYTRSCRCIIDPNSPGGNERAQLWWSAIGEYNPGGPTPTQR